MDYGRTSWLSSVRAQNGHLIQSPHASAIKFLKTSECLYESPNLNDNRNSHQIATRYPNQAARCGSTECSFVWINVGVFLRYTNSALKPCAAFTHSRIIVVDVLVVMVRQQLHPEHEIKGFCRANKKKDKKASDISFCQVMHSYDMPQLSLSDNYPQ